MVLGARRVVSVEDARGRGGRDAARVESVGLPVGRGEDERRDVCEGAVEARDGIRLARGTGRRVARRVSVRIDRRERGGLAARLGRRVRVDGRRREGRGNRGISQDVLASHRLRALARDGDGVRRAAARVVSEFDSRREGVRRGAPRSFAPAFVRVHAIAQGRRRRRRGVARRARRRKRLAARARALRVDVAAREARVRRSGRSISGELR